MHDAHPSEEKRTPFGKGNRAFYIYVRYKIVNHITFQRSYLILFWCQNFSNFKFWSPGQISHDSLRCFNWGSKFMKQKYGCCTSLEWRSRQNFRQNAWVLKWKIKHAVDAAYNWICMGYHRILSVADLKGGLGGHVPGAGGPGGPLVEKKYSESP